MHVVELQRLISRLVKGVTSGVLILLTIVSQVGAESRLVTV